MDVTACLAPHPTPLPAQSGERERVYGAPPQNALNVMIVCVSWMPGMV
jgi:hypothetical protein